MPRFRNFLRLWKSTCVPVSLAVLVLLHSPAGAQSQPPAITRLDPPRVAQTGLPGFTLYVEGSNFVSGSVVQWQGANRDTVFVNSRLLRVELVADDLLNEGAIEVRVINPSGDRSNVVFFDIGVALDPERFEPRVVTAGSTVPIILKVVGRGFAPGDQVNWNNQADSRGNLVFKETVFVSRTELLARLLPEDVAQGAPPNWQVSVHDSEGEFLAGDIASAANPVPIVRFSMPSSALAGDRAFDLSIRGSGFVRAVPDQGISATTVRWNGADRASSVSGPDEIIVGVQEGDILLPGSADITLSNPEPGGGSQTYPFAITQFSNLYLPRLITRRRTGAGTDDSAYSGIAVVNLDAERSADLRFTAYATSGSAVSDAGVTNPAPMSLSAGRQRALVDTQLFGEGLAERNAPAWMWVESTVSRIAGFFLIFNDSLSILDGADLTSSPVTSFVLPEIEDQGFTQIHVANPGPASAGVTLDLLRSDGTARSAPAVRNLGPNASLVEGLAELFPGAAPDPSDYVRATSTRGVVAFESFGRGTRYVAGLNAQHGQGGAAVLYSPQYVTGGAYRSTLSVVNLENVDGSVTFELFSDTGAPVGVPQTRTIRGRGKVYVDSQSFFADPGGGTVQGYVKVSSNGPRISGSIVFGDPDRNVFSSALPLSAILHTEFVLSQLASDTTYFTGIAVLNPHEVGVNAAIEVRAPDGAVIASTVEPIPARQRMVRVLTELFPQLAGQNRSSGYIRVSADRGVAGYGLYGTHSLSVLSAVPAQRVR